MDDGPPPGTFAMLKQVHRHVQKQHLAGLAAPGASTTAASKQEQDDSESRPTAACQPVLAALTDASAKELSNSYSVIKTLLSGWLASLAEHESKAGAHHTSSPSQAVETLAMLSSSLDFPLKLVVQKPAVLIFKPEAPIVPPAAAAGGDGSFDALMDTDAQVEKEEELLEFLLPKLLRGAAALELAVLVSEEPRGQELAEEDEETQGTSAGVDYTPQQVQIKREKLLAKMELFLARCIIVLAESTTRSSEGFSSLEKDPAAAPLGLRKAKRFMGELSKLLRELVKLQAVRAMYPLTYQLYRRSAPALAPAQPGAAAPGSIAIKSRPHAQAFALCIVRVMLRCIKHSPLFFSECLRDISDGINSIWPAVVRDTAMDVDVDPKGKGKAVAGRSSSVRAVVGDNLLLQCLSLSQELVGLRSGASCPLPPTMLELLTERLLEVLLDYLPDLSSRAARELIEGKCVELWAAVWLAAKDGETTPSRVVSSLNPASRDKVADSVWERAYPSSLHFSCLIILALAVLPAAPRQPLAPLLTDGASERHLDPRPSPLARLLSPVAFNSLIDFVAQMSPQLPAFLSATNSSYGILPPRGVLAAGADAWRAVKASLKEHVRYETSVHNDGLYTDASTSMVAHSQLPRSTSTDSMARQQSGGVATRKRKRIESSPPPPVYVAAPAAMDVDYEELGLPPSTAAMMAEGDMSAPNGTGGRSGAGGGQQELGAARKRGVIYRERLRTTVVEAAGGDKTVFGVPGMTAFVGRLGKLERAQAVAALQAIGKSACARAGTLVFATDDDAAAPLCSICEAHVLHADSSSSVTTQQQLLHDRNRSADHARADDLLEGVCRGLDTLASSGAEPKVVALALATSARLLRHSSSQQPSGTLAMGSSCMESVVDLLEAKHREVRMAAGNLLCVIVTLASDEGLPTQDVHAFFQRIDGFMQLSAAPVLETLINLLSKLALATPPQSTVECQCLKRLLPRLGVGNAYLASLARIQIARLAEARDLRPYALVQPHFGAIMPHLVATMQKSPGIIDQVCRCFGQEKETFLRVTRDYTLPFLVASNRIALIRNIAEASGTDAWRMMTDETSTSAAILAHIYLQPDVEWRAGTKVFEGIIKEGANARLTELMPSVRVNLLYYLAFELGDESEVVRAAAETALRRVARHYAPEASKTDTKVVAAVIKGSIVGILSLMNRTLNESNSHKPIPEKQKAIRALEALMSVLGPPIASVSPQVMATLQSALEAPSLRTPALSAFKQFIQSLPFSKLGPFVGPASAVFVRLWAELNAEERRYIVEIFDYIVVDNRDDTTKLVREIADLSSIPELAAANKRLSEIRREWDFETRSRYLLSRVSSENEAVSLQALAELRTLMKAETAKMAELSAGDTFDNRTGQMVKALISAACRDGRESQQVRNLAFECIGILGALDPDRLELPAADAPMIVLHNFTDKEECDSFAMHLIVHLLIGAYRSTNDTKHQEALGYAIQELLKLSRFTSEMFDSTRPQPPEAQRLLKSIPEAVYDTCSSLLNSQLSFKEKTVAEETQHPIYGSKNSYREWIRSWVVDLVQKIPSTAPMAKAIFTPFFPVLRLEDTTVAQYLLPHLVLTALILLPEERTLIYKEMEAVFKDVVNASDYHLPEASRLLCAQTIFDLMDHISRWSRKIRQHQQAVAASAPKDKRGRIVAPVDDREGSLMDVEITIQKIPQIVVATAALKCRAYARSLLNFESRIVSERVGKLDESQLQTYYENLHECYARLEEPDGMEGVSTKIVSPDTWHQIREHESTGRWTSAQSCWEVMLQRNPEDIVNHVGLLQCLRNLGHYDSMRTHIDGLTQNRHWTNEWERHLAPFTVEASLITKDWASIETALRVSDGESPQTAFGKVILSMRGDEELDVQHVLSEAREQLGSPIAAAGKESYRRIYDAVVNLHILEELESIWRVRQASETAWEADDPSLFGQLQSGLQRRLNVTSPSFKAREPILNMRRAAFSLSPIKEQRDEVGNLWLQTSKIARKSGYPQTAYSAILQAQELQSDVTYHHAKLLYEEDQVNRAIQELDNALKGVRDDLQPVPSTGGRPSAVAKAALRRARWLHETGRCDVNDMIKQYQVALKLGESWESTHYYLGRYWDELYKNVPTATKGSTEHPVQMARLFSNCLRTGAKFIYQAMPRMLTLYFEMSEEATLVKFVNDKARKGGTEPPPVGYEAYVHFTAYNKVMMRNTRKIPAYQWLTVLPQLVSRICHVNDLVHLFIEQLLAYLLVKYPHHAFWALASGIKSSNSKRQKRCLKVMQKAKESASAQAATQDTVELLSEANKLVDNLLRLCNAPVPDKTTSIQLSKTVPDLTRPFKEPLIIPLQGSLNVSLPSDASQVLTHNPFPSKLVKFSSFREQIDVMSSLAKPKKITIQGDDGQKYSFLCKPKDDLRKDARLMEFNSMIIKLLKKDTDSRTRRLYIRTYAVVPINEECGLIEWVPNVVVLRGILLKLYAARSIQTWSSEVKKIFETIKAKPAQAGAIFDEQVLTRFPPVFHEWFLETFPEPSAWFRARLTYSRTAAVISMVGFVLGLGDRHCENILLEANTGDTVHVDFNCLFDKGQEFDVPERVPFRLTQNIIDGMGVTGVEGVFRRAAEITLNVLRLNRDSLMSVLETFTHDPLLEWDAKRKGRHKEGHDGVNTVSENAQKSLRPILMKLRGLQATSEKKVSDKEVSVGEQVERLIREARASGNLGSMYVGWCSWF